MVVIVPRLVYRLAGSGDALAPEIWQGTTVAVPDGTWRDVLTGATFDGPELALPEVFATCPIAVLARNPQEIST